MELAFQLIRTKLHVAQYIRYPIAFDDFTDHDPALLIEPDMHRIGVSKEVVQITENLLVSADQKYADQVIRTGVGMQFQY